MERVDSGLEFDSLVVKSPIPVMVEFVDPLCEFCDFIEPAMNQLAQEFEGKCKFYKLDISLNREIAAKCGVLGYVPYFMMFKGGFTGMRIRGPATYEELRKLVTTYVKLSS
ncbi:unnamed protein product [Microthlaspi erraticum]|uniref:Thioredoxin domain-containing protein n=1 Tax=Microthlaspi erraticum TaxID=1685480 RepID=A0A6D2HGD5_9BRAS|nr:unnamed protein product [Microthlaspi erraticum]